MKQDPWWVVAKLHCATEVLQFSSFRCVCVFVCKRVLVMTCELEYEEISLCVVPLFFLFLGCPSGNITTRLRPTGSVFNFSY